MIRLLILIWKFMIRNNNINANSLLTFLCCIDI